MKRKALIMFALLAMLLITTLLGSHRSGQAAPADTTVGGPITVDTTWDVAGSPYIATSSLVVMPGVTLTIEPGVTVKFDAEKALVVNGSLAAWGTEPDPIRFTANTNDPAPGYWGFIKFSDSYVPATGCGQSTCPALDWVVVEYAGYDPGAINQPAIHAVETSDLRITHATVRHNGAHGIGAQTAHIEISDSEIAYNLESGISIDNFNSQVGTLGPLVLRNHVHHNRGGDNQVGGYVHPFSRGGGGIWLRIFSSVGVDVSDNLVEHNASPGRGGGIWIEDYSIEPLTAQGNIIRHNIARVAGGAFGSYIAFVDNEVYDNMAYEALANNGLGFAAGIGGLSAESWLDTTGNIIAENHDVEGYAGGAYLNGSYGAALTEVNVFGDNVIAGNRSVEGVGGLRWRFDWFDNNALTGNSIVHNFVESGVPGVRMDTTGTSRDFTGTFAGNTLSENVRGDGADVPFNTALCLYCQYEDAPYDPGNRDVYHITVNGNDLLRDYTRYKLTNGLIQSADTLDATDNYWNTSQLPWIQDNIFDFFDDSAYGIVDYSNYWSGPNIDTPVQPPWDLSVTVSGGGFDLEWHPISEIDRAGYRVYYDDGTGYPYEGTGADQGPSGIDVAETVYSLRLTGLPANKWHYFTVTAYDDDGNESWHSLEVRSAIGDVPFSNGDFEQGNNGDWTENLGKIVVSGAAMPDEISPRSGDFAAILGFADRRDVELSQIVTIDPAASTLRFHYVLWLLRGGNYICGGTPEVRVDGVAVATFDGCTDTVAQGWQPYDIDLSAYAGETVTLSFFNHTTGGNVLMVDDVSFIADGTSPPPQMESNYADGAPGSYFTLQATNLPSDSNATIYVNGTPLHSALTSGVGALPFVLDFAVGLSPGYYNVLVEVPGGERGSLGTSPNVSVELLIEIAEDAPLRALEDPELPIVEVPTDVPPPVELVDIYLPLILR
jgi:hypothetical protein